MSIELWGYWKESHGSTLSPFPVFHFVFLAVLHAGVLTYLEFDFMALSHRRQSLVWVERHWLIDSTCSNNAQGGRTSYFSAFFNYRNILPASLWSLPPHSFPHPLPFLAHRHTPRYIAWGAVTSSANDHRHGLFVIEEWSWVLTQQCTAESIQRRHYHCL